MDVALTEFSVSPTTGYITAVVDNLIHSVGIFVHLFVCLLIYLSAALSQNSKGSLPHGTPSEFL